MPKEIVEVVTCDVCGKEICGDYATVEVSFGLHDETYYVCLPRIAPVNPCGNVTINKVRAILGNSNRLDES